MSHLHKNLKWNCVLHEYTKNDVKSLDCFSQYIFMPIVRKEQFKNISSLEFAASSTTHELITPISASSFSGAPCAKRDFVYAGI